MRDHRRKNVSWDIPPIDAATGSVSHRDATLAVMMDIRDELIQINRTLACRDTRDIPRLLRSIKTNTTKPKRRKT